MFQNLFSKIITSSLEDEFENTITEPNFNYNYLHEYLYGWIVGRGDIYFIKETEPYVSINLYDNEEFDLFSILIQEFDEDDYSIDYVKQVWFSPNKLFNILIGKNNPYAVVKIYDKNIIKLCYNSIKQNEILNKSKLFYRGYFEATSGKIDVYENGIEIVLNDDSGIEFMENYLIKYNGINHEGEMIWSDMYALDFITEIYQNYENCSKLSNLVKINDAKKMYRSTIPTLNFTKTRADAIEPFKDNITESGFHISVIEQIKEMNGIYYYTTGLRFKIDYGYYIELYGYNLHEHGYALANGTLIIENSNTDEIIIPLVKLNNYAPELKLPIVVAKCIHRKINIVELEQSH